MLSFKEYLETNNNLNKDYVQESVSWAAKFVEFCKERKLKLSVDYRNDFLVEIGVNQEEFLLTKIEKTLDFYFKYIKNRDEINSNNEKVDKNWIRASKEMEEIIRQNNMSLNTEMTYMSWVRRFYHFLANKKPVNLSQDDVKEFLSDLSLKKAAASTQAQAFNAISFLYSNVLNIALDSPSKILNISHKQKLPIVMTKEECLKIIDQLEGAYNLMTKLVYGSGLRLTECVELRVGNIDFERNAILVKNAKNKKDRETLLPESIKTDLKDHLNHVREIFNSDRESHRAHNLPNEFIDDWDQEWLFPSRNLTVDPETGISRRYHVNLTSLQKKVKTAVRNTGVNGPISIHSFRHSFAVHLVEAGYDIKLIKELLGHSSVQTTMVYNQIAKTNKLKVISPLEETGD